MLQVIIIMPFIIMQQLTMLPCIIVQRFWSMLAAVASSQTHVIFMPPSQRSICIVQRGIIIRFMPVGVAIGAFMAMPAIMGIIAGVICRSIVIMVFFSLS
jgi:hypothetical protein